MLRTTLIAGIAAALISPLFAGGEGWMTDFEAAKKKAADENKNLLVDFTGTDWCVWCIRLSKEVFQHDEFSDVAADKFVFVELDYPKDKSLVDEKTTAQNKELKDVYQIKGYPTILLMDADGIPFGKTGYKEGGPKPYLEHLDTHLATKAQFDSALKEAESLSGLEKSTALIIALKLLPTEIHYHYSDLMEEIKELDPEDSTGFYSKQEQAEAMKKLSQLATTAGPKGFDGAEAFIDAYLEKYQPEGAARQEILNCRLRLYLICNKNEEAGKLAEEVIAIDPSSREGQTAVRVKNHVAKQKAPADKEKEASQ